MNPRVRRLGRSKLPLTRPEQSDLRVSGPSTTMEARRPGFLGELDPTNQPASSKTTNLSRTETAVTALEIEGVDTKIGKEVPDDQDAKPSAAKHNTRSRNGIDKSKTTKSSKEEQEEMEQAEKALERGASFLSALDSRAYHRALMTDANAILDQILLPQFFPWDQRAPPVGPNVPCDIDEMNEIKKAGDDVTEDHGFFSKIGHKNRHPGNSNACAFRCKDKGSVKLTSITRPSRAKRRFSRKLGHWPAGDKEAKVEGELSLRSFEHVSADKKRRLNKEEGEKITKTISIRFASTSSRSSVFDWKSLLLPATLPPEVQIGSRNDTSDAFVSSLGSYDCRHGFSAQQKPTVSGRTRKFWSKKFGGPPLRFVYKSILDGSRLENGTHKRPRCVKVGIRLNGQVLESEDDRHSEYARSLGAWGNKQDVDADIEDPFNERTISKAVQKAFAKPKDAPVKKPMCSIDYASLSSKALAHFGAASQADPAAADGQLLQIKKPTLDSLPTGDGLLRSICSKPGALSCPDPVALSQFMDKEACTRKLCMTCWSDAADVVPCKGCNLHVHPECYGGLHSFGGVCLPCSTVSKSNAGNLPPDMTEKRQKTGCDMCPFLGGSISRYGGKWSHALCRWWSSSSPSEEVGTCALCSSSNKHSSVIKCAANGCQIAFHPMCAASSSIVSYAKHKESSGRTVWTGGDLDVFHCTQYTFSMVNSSTVVDGGAKICLIPIAFCGLHNPKRDADFIGLPPGKSYVSTSVRVPPRRGSSK